MFMRNRRDCDDPTNPSTSGLEDYLARSKREGGLTPVFAFGIVLIPAIIVVSKARAARKRTSLGNGGG